MMHNHLSYLIATERAAELQRGNWRNRLNRVYLDKERQPRILKYWANR